MNGGIKMTTFLGNPVTLEGEMLKVGDQMPDFEVVTTDLEPFHPMEEKGKKIILAVPSVDTGVCNLELEKFMEYVKGYDDIQVISVSMDLPFALNRWCQAHKGNVLTTSDYKDHDFAKKTGTRMSENGLLARIVFVTDQDGKLTYVEYVDEVGNEPHYDQVLKAAGI